MKAMKSRKSVGSGKSKRWRVAGINFDHFHMGDLLRFAAEHPRAEIVGISDEKAERMEEAVRKLGLPREKAFTDYKACLEETRPDIVILCPAASKHGEWVKKVAPSGAHIRVEKPFAASSGQVGVDASHGTPSSQPGSSSAASCRRSCC